MKKFNRRNFMKGASASAVSASKLGLISKVIYDGMFSKALASSNGTIKKYLYFQQYGAPSRWVWDLPLTPDGNMSKFIPCKSVGTRYKGTSRYTEVEYATHLVNGLHMPWMWQFDVAAADGGMRPMSDLMDGLMIIRGCSSTNPGHVAAQRLHYLPLGAKYSVTALASDVSSAPVPAIAVGGSAFQYRSRKGSSPTLLRFGAGGINLIEALMTPFQKESLGGFEADQENLESAINSSRQSLDDLAKQNLSYAEALDASTKDALKMLNSDFGNLGNIYNILFGKYRDLCARSFTRNRNLVGVTDKPIGTTGTRGSEYYYGNGTASKADMREIIQHYTDMSVTAANFALAEFAMLNNITASLTMNILGIDGLSQGGNSGQFFDEHSAGCMPNTLYHINSGMGYSACLIELISQLKAADMYKDTVIDFSGEFGRIPQANGGGSDHSAEATSNTILSGAIEGTHVVGNIIPNAGGQPGTWGFQGTNPTYGKLNVGHFAASIASLLGAESPVTAVPSIMILQPNGKFRPNLPTGTIVDS